MGKLFNQTYLDSIPSSKKSVIGRVRFLAEAAIDKNSQKTYDIFLSHSSKDKDLVGKIRDVIEKEFGFEAYVDWDENSGMKRTEVADIVKNVMQRCKTLLIIKTKNSDESSWVSWETGYFEALKFKNRISRFDKIGVLVIEDDGYSERTVKRNSECYHQEYLLRYTFVNENNLRDFIRRG